MTPTHQTIRIPFKTAFKIAWNKLEQADPAFLKHPDAKAALSHWLLAPEIRPPLLPKVFEDDQFVFELKSAIAKAAKSSHRATGAQGIS
jgi:hypothetical protein